MPVGLAGAAGAVMIAEARKLVIDLLLIPSDLEQREFDVVRCEFEIGWKRMCRYR
jgi:hypothetical protein